MAEGKRRVAKPVLAMVFRSCLAYYMGSSANLGSLFKGAVLFGDLKRDHELENYLHARTSSIFR